jgi:Flp pilus assembly protein TadD
MGIEKIAGYEILGTLGEGGMGIVYRARDATLDREIALKVIRPSALGGQGRERFIREARACSRINHPNIVTVYGAGEENETPYIAMELLRGRTMREIIDEGPVPWRQAVRWVADVLDALGRLHAEGIVHRDLKPENIIITTDGIAKLMDFGIARLAKSETLTIDGTTLGTIHYMSPEQVQGRTADARSDVFSAGAVLYELLTAERAFPGEHPLAAMYAITSETPRPIGDFLTDPPPGLPETVARALEKNPEARFADAGAFRDALGAVVTSGETPSTIAAAGKRAHVRALIGVSAVAGVVIAGVIFAVIWKGSRDRQLAIRYNEKAMTAWETGDLARADSLLRKALSIKPRFPQILMNLGDLNWDRGDFTGAEKAYRAAIDADSSFVYAYNNFARFLIDRGRAGEAAALIDCGLGKNAERSSSDKELRGFLLKNRGTAAAQLDRGDEALAYWLRAVDLIPDNAELHADLASSYERSGKLDDARAHWLEVERLGTAAEKARAAEHLDRLRSSP